MQLQIRSTIIFIVFCYSGLATGGYKDDIAYSQLATELGTKVPNGKNVIAIQSEADTSYVDHDDNATTSDLPVYLPNKHQSYFYDKSILDITGFRSGSYSSHATSVAKMFYGNRSIAPAIDTVHTYWADQWLQSNVLNHGTGKPQSTSARIGNHSWVGNILKPAIITNILRRIDWMIETDDFLQIVGTRNSIGTNYNLLSSAYNVLAVGKTDGNHSTGSPLIDKTYLADRNRTEIVAPFSVTSTATPVVTAAAALLIETGHSHPELSTDPVKTSSIFRNGNTIYNAERSEVIKAALLAGASRLTKNTNTLANIKDYRITAKHQTRNGLDARFGAGQLNVYNSYHIIAAGEQNSKEDGGEDSTSIKTFGFDYDPTFGGASDSNNIASYYFSTDSTQKTLTASLSWHIDIDSGNQPRIFSGKAHFYDLDLYLYDVTDKKTLIIRSNSQIDNSENIWQSLNPNRKYLLQVMPKSGQNSFNWDYALAWRITADIDKNRN